jgi:hypothetical protein
MQYLLMIFNEEADNPMPGTPGFGKMTSGYEAFGNEMTERGLIRGGNALQPATTATTVRVRSGQRLVTDGPFAETKEQLGGYYVLECKDLDEAIECASKIPGAENGSIEIRPIRQFD